MIELLEMLEDDQEEYVRRSVANNPALAVETAARWWSNDPNTRRMVRHGLRTLIKAGDPDALAILGFGSDSPVRLQMVTVEPAKVHIGESIRIAAFRIGMTSSCWERGLPILEPRSRDRPAAKPA